MIKSFDDIGDSIHGDNNRFRLCMASRHYPTIVIRNGQRIVLEDEDGHSEDLQKYIRHQLKVEKGELAEKIPIAVHEKANGVFMWAVLVISHLNNDFRGGRNFLMWQRLKELPNGLSDLFRNLLRRDDANMHELLLCLQWVLFARRPLTMQEFCIAMISELYPNGAAEAWKDDTEAMTRYIQTSSKGLAELTKSKTAPRVQFIHESVNDFLLKDDGLRELWPELGEADHLRSVSHDRLKQCCLHYLTSGVSNMPSTAGSSQFKSDKDKTRGDEPKKRKSKKARSKEHKAKKSKSKEVNKEAKVSREIMAVNYPFMAYASSEVLFHANEAAHMIAQEHFMELFPFDRWIYVSNVYETYDVRRHAPEVTMIYVLAEKGYKRLIQATGTLHLWRRCVEERYQYPFVAAFANGHEDTLIALSATTEEAYAYALGSDRGFGKRSELRYNQDTLLWATDNGNWALAERLLAFNVEGIFAKEPLAQKFAFPTLGEVQSDDSLSLAARSGKYAIVRQLRQREMRPIHLVSACEGGWKEFVQLLLDWGSDVNGRVPDFGKYINALEAASAEGHKLIARFLLDRGADVNMPGNDALARASENGHEAIVELLLKRGANVDTEKRHGCTALQYASAKGHQKIVEILLEYGALVDRPEHTQHPSALQSAARGGHEHIVELLLRKSADVNAVTDHSTALVAASLQDSVPIVELLLLKDADVTAQDREHGSALKAACYKGHEDIVRMLHAKGADVNAQDRKQRSALQAACHKGREAIVRLLIGWAADVNARDESRSNALIAACGRGSPEIVRLLLHAGADVDAKDEGHKTALIAACGQGSEETVQLLLKYEAYVDAKDRFGNTALMAACSQGSEGIVRLLLASGANVNDPPPDNSLASDRKGNALGIAACDGHESIVRLLLKYGANVNSEPGGRGNALWNACHEDHETIVRLLLEHGADMNAKSPEYGTPLATAVGMDCKEIAQLLTERGAVHEDGPDADGHVFGMHWDKWWKRHPRSRPRKRS
ncbi:hypothetical protein CKM354_000687100 [Cercospora kikuchii]|uniref:Uncharacterized protein n=1 Tax=Cercospora kikuchii TaxID=84275 RepID=A0A9P3CIW6_9PEZI|nr:uncharacterized protein CKM354_000687100 [Cercospora kikuchii]GIZ43654.1 hypothetical protein CKM354_000687100 [Cercospora kikuchii]